MLISDWSSDVCSSDLCRPPSAESFRKHPRMKVLVTGSAGHLGEALVRSLQDLGQSVVGLDQRASPYTSRIGSLVDRAGLRHCLSGVGTVYHAATLHKPHVATHSRQDFVDPNITGTLNLLEEAVDAGVGAFVFTSTTSVFGNALTRSEEHTSELQSLMRISYAVFCLKKKIIQHNTL